MMYPFLFAFGLIVCILCMAGCIVYFINKHTLNSYADLANKENAIFDRTTKIYVQKYENIERIFMNKSDWYTFMVRDGDKLKTVDVRSYDGGCEHCWEETVNIIDDVPEDQGMYAILTINLSKTTWDLEIHIHTPVEIEGGHWQYRYGKRTYEGRVQEIE